MFKNIGGKIKVLAVILTWIGIVFSVLIGALVAIGGYAASGFVAGEYTFSGGSAIALGVIIAIVGSLSSWIGNFMIYGFGELIDKTTQIARSAKHEQL